MGACESWSRGSEGQQAHHGVAVHVDLLVLALVGNAPASHALAVIPLLLHLARHLVVDVGWEEGGGSALSCGCPWGPRGLKPQL